MGPQRLALAALLVGAATALAGCGQRSETSADKGGAQQVELVARSDLKFSVDTLSVKAGQPVALVLRNEDTAQLHDFTILKIPVKDVRGGNEAKGENVHAGMDMGMEPALHVSVQPGQTGRLEFTPTDRGQYEFFCTVPGHKDAGMKGTLTVN
ncbi:cupredoxin domain-containing protein [Caldinitratiruptor microaerophilus]|uniref:Blue (type 1) copper domain-containing protein n=1 Tax=Caldinitratiruptor microaerophilus TaxID=671077 RepID=A0AA35CLG4_9FIRM|nr:plastocyanin/azurin family copper-binding protein [Caldinitratiruptor microaerophilus]BDG61499.1 hypothetical protein caldi_25890 [Caldinitratiruptor microaerophilus]